MEKEYFISVYLDTRRKLKNYKYPVKLRVFTKYPRKQKLYPTKFEFTENEFKSVWLTQKPRNEVKLKRAEIQTMLNKAEKAADKLDPFTFEAFESALSMKSGTLENIFFQYEKVIQQYEGNKQIGTASNYDLSQKAIKKFLKEIKGNVPDVLLFREINPKWLLSFENYMTDNGKSQTTIGIYLRPLRALFNSAIAEGIIKQSLYPFGRRKYEIPQSKSVKKALTRGQLKKLYDTKPSTPEQQMAKDYFFFLFNCSGLNVKDMASLKYENLQGDKLVYTREKTKRTSKANLKPVVVYLNEYSKSFIEQYGNKEKKKSNLIFDIYTNDMSEEERYRKSHNFTRFLNQHLKLLAKANGLPEDISTYWSRHSFATNAIRSGASLEQISQALNHHDLATTKGYFAGFEDDAMRALTKNLMNFD